MCAYARIILATVFISLFHISEAWPVNIQAPSCSQSDVQSAVISANNGDTVNVPAGSCTWTSSVNMTKAIHLHGAGYTGAGVTQITSGLANTIIFNLTSCASAPEIDGFLFVDTNAGDDNTQGMVNFKGSCGQIKAHDNKLIHASSGKNNFFYVSGYVYGVIYNNVMDNTSGAGGGGLFESVNHSTWGGGSYNYGDGSWIDDPNYTGAGNDKFLYIEGNTYTNANRSGFSDMWNGSRVVERYNTIVNGNPNSHGFDSTNNGRGRAMRIKIVYNNTISGPSNFPTCLQIRGGTGLVYDNTFTGWQAGSCITAKTYRYTDVFVVDPLSTTTGICRPYNASDQYAQYAGAHYMCSQGSGGSQACCKGPGSYNPSCVDPSACTGGAGYCVGPLDNTDGSGPSGVTGAGRWCRDGIGRGKDGGFGTAQASEPIFVFNNTGANSGFNPSADATMNQDYYSDKSGSVASGLASARPSTYTPGYGYWATDTRVLYRCGSDGKSWSLYYAEHPCPHPLTGRTGKCNATVAGAAGYPAGYQSTTLSPPTDLRIQ